MMIYNAQIGGTLGATTTAIATVISGATRSALLLEIDVNGQATASATNEIGIYRVATAGVTGSSALTFSPVDAPTRTGTTPAIAFSGTGFGAYSTQPVKGALIHNAGLNANGQRYFWRCNPNLNNAIVIPGGNNAAGSIAVVPISGSSVVTGRLQLAEL
jgi:hypothetical protein